MKANMALLPELDERVRGKQQRYGVYTDRAQTALADYLAQTGFVPVISQNTQPHTPRGEADARA